jgi:hypothetical protein
MPPRSNGHLFVAAAAALMLGCAGYVALRLEAQSSTPEAAAALERFHQQVG